MAASDPTLPTPTFVTWRATSVGADHTIRAAFQDEAGRTFILAMPPLEALKLCSSIADTVGGFFDDEVKIQPSQTKE